MPSITSTGVGSGLDVNTIVTSLMALEKRPLTQLQAQAGSLQTRLSAFGTLKSQLAAVGDMAAKLATPASWSTMRVDSGNSAAVSATAAAGAVPARHTVEVSQLAQSQVLASGPFAASTSVVGTGKLMLELGTTSGASFTPKSGSLPVFVTVDAGHNTLAGVRDAINAANAGVTATVVNDASGARLVLRGADGAASSVRLTATDDDGNNTDTAGLSALAYDPAATAGAGCNLTQTQAAQDANFKIDGIALTSATNTPSDALEGVTLTLSQVTTAPVSLNVAIETMAVRKNVNDFVNAYNGLNALLKQQTQADPSGKATGALQADSTANSVLMQLRDLLHGTVSGLGSPASLSAAGIELQRDGSLTVNDAKLTPLLSTPGKLASLFSQAPSGSDTGSQGIALRFKSWAQGLTGDAGLLASRMDGIKRSTDDNQKQQDAMQDRLDRTESRLRAQYQQLDTQMSSLNSRLAQMKSALGLA